MEGEEQLAERAKVRKRRRSAQGMRGSTQTGCLICGAPCKRKMREPLFKND